MAPLFVNAGDTEVFRSPGTIIDMAYNEYTGVTYFASYPIESRRSILGDPRMIPLMNPGIYSYHAVEDSLIKLDVENYDKGDFCVMGIDVFPDFRNYDHCFLYFSNHKIGHMAISIFGHHKGSHKIYHVRDVVHPDLITDPRGVLALEMCVIAVVNCHEDSLRPCKGTCAIVYVTEQGLVKGSIQVKGLNNPRSISGSRSQKLVYLNGPSFFSKKSIGVYSFINTKYSLQFVRKLKCGIIPEGIHVDQKTGDICIGGAPEYFERWRFKKRFAKFPETICQSRVIVLKSLRQNNVPPQIVYAEDGTMMSASGKCILLPCKTRLLLSSQICAGLLVARLEFEVNNIETPLKNLDDDDFSSWPADNVRRYQTQIKQDSTFIKPGYQPHLP